MGKMSAEARARLAGEAQLIRRHRKEFDRLLKTRSRNDAIVALVAKRKVEYGELVKANRDRFAAEAAA